MKSLSLLKKYKHFKKIDKIFRVRSNLLRYKKIRLDKNERLTDFESYFIDKIKNNLFVSEFLNFKLYEKINPDIIILSDISWYVLPELKKFINWYVEYYK